MICSALKKLPTPLFDLESATANVKAAEDAWNTKQPDKVALAYTPDSVWRNRDKFFSGRDAIVEFFKNKWDKEQQYKLRKTLWCFDTHKISVKFQYEWHYNEGQWHSSYGNELWEFDDNGLMARRGKH